MTLSLTDCCAVAGLGPGVSPAVSKAAPKVKENRRRDGSFDYYNGTGARQRRQGVSARLCGHL